MKTGIEKRRHRKVVYWASQYAIEPLSPPSPVWSART